MFPFSPTHRLLAAALAALALCSCDGGDDDGADTDDDAAACQSYCDSLYADDAEGCDACAIESSLSGSTCSCEFLSCVQELCVEFCESLDAGADSALCYLSTCTCG